MIRTCSWWETGSDYFCFRTRKGGGSNAAATNSPADCFKISGRVPPISGASRRDVDEIGICQRPVFCKVSRAHQYGLYWQICRWLQSRKRFAPRQPEGGSRGVFLQSQLLFVRRQTSSSMLHPNTCAIFLTVSTPGSTWPFSQRLISLPRHPMTSASCPWVMPAAWRAAFHLSPISILPFCSSTLCSLLRRVLLSHSPDIPDNMSYTAYLQELFYGTTSSFGISGGILHAWVLAPMKKLLFYSSDDSFFLKCVALWHIMVSSLHFKRYGWIYIWNNNMV